MTNNTELLEEIEEESKSLLSDVEFCEHGKDCKICASHKKTADVLTRAHAEIERLQSIEGAARELVDSRTWEERRRTHSELVALLQDKQ